MSIKIEGVVVVFQVKEQLATVVIHIIKQGGAPLEVSDLAIEPVRYQIVVRAFEKPRVRQFHQTRRAELSLIGCQPLAADRAEARY